MGSLQNENFTMGRISALTAFKIVRDVILLHDHEVNHHILAALAERHPLDSLKLAVATFKSTDLRLHARLPPKIKPRKLVITSCSIDGSGFWGSSPANPRSNTFSRNV